MSLDEFREQWKREIEERRLQRNNQEWQTELSHINQKRTPQWFERIKQAYEGVQAESQDQVDEIFLEIYKEDLRIALQLDKRRIALLEQLKLENTDWVCSSCTFSNGRNIKQCQVCSLEHDIKNPEQAKKQGTKHIDLLMWICSICASKIVIQKPWRTMQGLTLMKCDACKSMTLVNLDACETVFC